MKKAKLVSLVSLSILVFLCLIGLIFFPQAEDRVSTETKEIIETEDNTLPPVSSSKDIPVTTEKILPVQTEHQHIWLITGYGAPLCEKDGVRIFGCSCGEKREEILPGLSHQFEGASCISPSKCKLCGAIGEKMEHHYVNAACDFCGQKITSPVYVMGLSFDFDESESSIIQKLGSPTEILTEGKFRSLVYSSLSQFTVFQIDGEGLWGVFTMDPKAFFHLDSKVVDFANFSGKKDPNSDTTYQTLGAFRIYGFRDTEQENACYGLWIHYSDISYHYMTNPDITDNFSAQSRLSFYYVNALRSRHGLYPLTWCDTAAQVSAAYSEKMAREDFFAHDYRCGERLTQLGILWKTCGENLSQGYTNAYFVTDAYYNSKDHRSNVLSNSFTSVGIGFSLKSDEKGPLSVLGAQTYYS